MSRIDPTTLAVSKALTKVNAEINKSESRIVFLEEAVKASHQHCDELQSEAVAANQQVLVLAAANEKLMERVGELEQLLTECYGYIPQRPRLTEGQVVYANSHSESAWKLSDKIERTLRQ